MISILLPSAYRPLLLGTLSLFSVANLMAGDMLIASTAPLKRELLERSTNASAIRPGAANASSAKSSDSNKKGRTPQVTKTPQSSGNLKSDKDAPSNKLTKIAINAKQGVAVIRHHVLAKADDRSISVVVDVGRQRAFLVVGGQVAIETPVSTGKPGHRTPRGTFKITERQRSGKISNRYNSPMPFWMRLGSSAVGLHTGHLPGTPASRGCIRLPSQIAPLFFKYTLAGTSVRVLNYWNKPSPLRLTS